MTKRLPPELKKHRRSIQKACVFCHEKHIQCDVSRPCKNCVKRNITSSCTDNIRKKRKANSPREIKSPSTDYEVSTTDIMDDVMTVIKKETYFETDLSGQETVFSPDQDFDSMWANEEYMKMKEFLDDPQCLQEPDVASIQLKKGKVSNTDESLLGRAFTDYSVTNSISNSNSNSDRNGSIPSTDTVFSKPFISLDMLSDSSLNDFSPIDEKDFLKEEDQRDQFDSLCEPSIITESMNNNNIINNNNGESNISPLQFRKGFPSVKDLYTNQDLIKPHNYQLAYAQMKNILQDKFSIEADQRLLPTLIKSIMDNYAPRFTSLSSSMIPEDLVFQEIMLQRLLFQMEDTATLVNCTPMAVWRRTGELCFTSNEFLSLTGFTKSEVFSTNRFIFEFWDNESILDYFNKFEKVLAFGDSNIESPETLLNKTNFGRCTLILKNNAKLNCASCWTVVRDNFNIPLLIMGQFLPIFSKQQQ
ncbi:similar to Saccharomyces cerevisiae YJL103C GSM1 Putative zinc cluster protein of unknown function [Maudiozyma barnettii]|uniref:Glucose starvation modulator protein 1 n=1 Tax=Maudiozyma barnettii TaxID=61262 RepID=A0A8H2VKH6_9SACH|nr:Gsm1p [Kazachstania barnettii]CAB4256965.1 similar to Saccharomyces cerevisiae YJL103C GSM1 Putative zinc cluster protein of unknown function [Kazachstania barnettii]CAD1785570.1 similar to Saccharomyces cerevisiae YJL103C GSM1 Putative zinc cluster protein of unknown function [Kazachstania barnettii]